MDERSRQLLKLLVERYISDGQPVGSRSLSKVGGVDLSPATIRNVMADLESLGLVTSPHTSAGRIPTPKGYRLFVDSLLTVRPLGPDQQALLDQGLPLDAPGRVVAQAAQLISRLSSLAGVISAPRQPAVFRHLEFIRLGERRILLILVTPGGEVHNRFIQTEQDIPQERLIEAGNFFTQHYSGLSIEEARRRLSEEVKALQSDLAALMLRAMDEGRLALRDADSAIVITGERQLLDVSEFTDDRRRLRELFTVFEEKNSLSRLLDSALASESIQIYIGGDSELVPAESLSVVTAPYLVQGQVVGTLGVIGPTRMAYDRMIPIVDITARLVSTALSQLASDEPSQY